MSPGDVEFVQLIAHLAVTIPVTMVVLLRDDRGLTGERLARAWPRVSRDAALLCFFVGAAGLMPLALAIHWTRTRASLAGAAVGLALASGVFALGLGAQLLADLTIDALGLV